MGAAKERALFVEEGALSVGTEGATAVDTVGSAEFHVLCGFASDYWYSFR